MPMPLALRPLPFTLAALLCFALGSGGTARAEADGPDFLRVTGIPADQTLALRAGPGPAHAVLTGIPADTDGLANFGCRGGLDLARWETATPAEREAARADRWCLVGHDAVLGWAMGLHLAEGADTGAFSGGGRFSELAGSEWQLRDLAGAPVIGTAYIAFAEEGRISGLGGCNRFFGGYESGPGTLRLDQMGMTQMACPEADMTLEWNFIRALEETRATAATHLLLALLDGEGRLLATLTRRDPD